MPTLEELVPLVRQHDADWFSQKYPGPFLVLEKPEDEESSAGRFSTATNLKPVKKPQSQDQPLDTQNLRQVMAKLREGGDLVKQHQLFTVEKTDRNPFSRGVTIGRTQNNDIVIPIASVSKFHAWIEREAISGLRAFLKGERERFSIYDSGSRYGTLVDGQKAPGEGAKGLLLSSGAKLELGDARLHFFDAAGLHRFISSKLVPAGLFPQR